MTAAQNAEPRGRLPKRRLVLVCVLFALAMAAYSGAVFHPFVGDDNLLIVENPRVRSLTGAWDVTQPRWTRLLTHALEYRLVGLWSPLYHFDNIVLHGLVGTLIFLLIFRVSGDEWLGWLTAALFVVHPIQTEVVAHVSGRRGLLAAAFALACLLFLERHVRTGKLWPLGAALVALYLGVFSKESAIMTVAVFPAVHLYARFHARAARPDGGRRPFPYEARSALGEGRLLYAAMAAGTIALVVLRGFLQGLVHGSPGTYEEVGTPLGPADRLSIAGFGLRMLILPLSQSADYRYDALGFVSGTHWPALGGSNVVLLLLALAATAYGLARRHWIGLGGIWFAAFFLPHAGLIPWHHVFSERFLYLPSVGFCLALAALLLQVSSMRGKTRLAVAAAVAIVAVWTGATRARAEVWSSETALWQSVVRRYPESAFGQGSLGGAYLRDGRPDLALVHYDKALEILPVYVDARMGAVSALVARGEYLVAMQRVDDFLERHPHHRQALNIKGFLQIMRGELAEAQATFNDLIATNPDFEHGYANLGRLLAMQGRTTEAVRMYEKALEKNPGLEPVRSDLARLRREQSGEDVTGY